MTFALYSIKHKYTANLQNIPLSMSQIIIKTIIIP